MKKISLAVLTYLLVATPALAENIGECGWGSKVFEGQRGIAPQSMAATTNGIAGNQTFAISSGTSGCTQNGVVRSTFKTAMYIDSNMELLARDVAIGEGESLEALASLLSVNPSDKELFNKTLQENFTGIFSSKEVGTVEVYASLKSVLADSEELAQYASTM